MSKFTDAADAIKRQLKTMEQWAFAAQALEEIGSLDNAAKEAQVALSIAQKERDAVRAEVAKAKEDARIAKTKVDATLLKAEADAELIVNEAMEKANGIEASAQGKAEAAITLAEANAKSIYDTAKLRSDNLSVDMAKKQITLDALNESIAVAEDRLAKADKQLASIKSKLASLVG